MILNTKDMEIQFVKMTDEKNEFGYVQDYDQLIAEAPNVEMAAKWENAESFTKK